MKKFAVLAFGLLAVGKANAEAGADCTSAKDCGEGFTCFQVSPAKLDALISLAGTTAEPDATGATGASTTTGPTTTSTTGPTTTSTTGPTTTSTTGPTTTSTTGPTTTSTTGPTTTSTTGATTTSTTAAETTTSTTGATTTSTTATTTVTTTSTVTTTTTDTTTTTTTTVTARRRLQDAVMKCVPLAAVAARYENKAIAFRLGTDYAAFMGNSQLKEQVMTETINTVSAAAGVDADSVEVQFKQGSVIVVSTVMGATKDLEFVADSVQEALAATDGIGKVLADNSLTVDKDYSPIVSVKDDGSVEAFVDTLVAATTEEPEEGPTGAADEDEDDSSALRVAGSMALMVAAVFAL